MRTSILSLAILLVAFSAVSVAAQAAPNLAGTMEAHKIVVGKENREVAMSADKVYPQDRIEYTLRYKNVGDESASGVSLVGPIPAGTVYLEKTATETRSMHPRYSIDGGKTYHDAPVYYLVTNAQGVEERKVAGPEKYTHVMWNVSDVLDAGKEIAVSYRVQVK